MNEAEKSFERAIRRNELNKMIKSVESRLKFLDRDISRADGIMEKAKAESARRELQCWRSELQSRLAKLRDDFNEGPI